MKTTPSRQPLCLLEQLEPRILLAGDVTAVVKARGDLVVNGTNADEQITIQQTDTGITITGHGDTTVNGQPSVELTGVTRNVRVNMKRGNDVVNVLDLDVARDLTIKTSGGDDAVHVFGAEVGRRLRADGGSSDDTYTQDETNVAGTTKVHRFEVDLNGSADAQAIRTALASDTPGAPLDLTDGDVMQAKLNQAIQTLQTRKLGEEEYLRAIDEAMEAIYTSNLVVLPTLGAGNTNTATNMLFSKTLQMMREANDALSKHVTDPRGGTPGSRKAAGDARNFIQVTAEAIQLIGQQTNQCNPNAQDPTQCQFLLQGDEGGNIVDDVLTDVVLSRQVRSPFPIFNVTTGTPQEQVIVPGPIGPDEIALVIKEIQGIKVVVTPRIIPIWVEPWFARATITGTRTVWCWEFVPAEMIKTLPFANVPIDPENPTAGRRIETGVDIQVILERQLLHFWRFAQKQITSVPG